MRKSLSLFSCVLAFAAFGCNASSDNGSGYEQAAQEVESAVAALDQADSDDTAIDAASDSGDAGAADSDSDSDEATEEANGGHADGKGDRDKDSDEATDEANGGGHKGGGKGGHGKGHHHGRGHDLLLWYADLDALQACRDLRETCKASADPSACKDDVHACVKPVLDAAFAAMCEERTAMCAAADAPEKACKRVAKHCGGDTGSDDGAAGSSADPTSP